jgi:hypothetical protein
MVTGNYLFVSDPLNGDVRFEMLIRPFGVLRALSPSKSVQLLLMFIERSNVLFVRGFLIFSLLNVVLTFFF